MPQLTSAFCEVDIKALKQVDELFDELVAQSQVITPATQKPKKSRSTEGQFCLDETHAHSTNSVGF